jgi:hypothetical protein
MQTEKIVCGFFTLSPHCPFMHPALRRVDRHRSPQRQPVVQEKSPMLRFAPRYGIISPALVRPSRRGWRPAVNDNQRATPGPVAGVIGDARVQAALRLFAVHGLAAAERARLAAANANARGDDDDARWWDEISKMLGQRARP